MTTKFHFYNSGGSLKENATKWFKQLVKSKLQQWRFRGEEERCISPHLHSSAAKEEENIQKCTPQFSPPLKRLKLLQNLP